MEKVMPKVICRKVGCKKLVEKGLDNGYCEDHKGYGEQKIEEAKKLRYATYDKDREPRLVSFYHGVKWKKLRLSALSRDNYLCQDCLFIGRIISAQEVHHIVEVKESWDKRYDEDNLVSLCKSCHRKRHSK